MNVFSQLRELLESSSYASLLLFQGITWIWGLSLVIQSTLQPFQVQPPRPSMAMNLTFLLSGSYHGARCTSSLWVSSMSTPLPPQPPLSKSLGALCHGTKSFYSGGWNCHRKQAGSSQLPLKLADDAFCELIIHLKQKWRKSEEVNLGMWMYQGTRWQKTMETQALSRFSHIPPLRSLKLLSSLHFFVSGLLLISSENIL